MTRRDCDAANIRERNSGVARGNIAPKISVMALTLRIGSRPSALALAQANLVKTRLVNAVQVLRIEIDLRVEIVPISTSGDKMTSASLARVGGKGLFIRELEQALAEHRVDIAVHSMKDLPAILPAQFRIAAVPEREDPRDVLITRRGSGWDALPPGARLGTSSTRRRLEALRLRPDLDVQPLRGNVDTRLNRLANGDFDAIILAMAGLKRLGRSLQNDIFCSPLDASAFIPSGGQGALAIEAIADETIGGSPELERAVAALNDSRATAEVTAERSFLATIGASCVSPVGVKGTVLGAALKLCAILFSSHGEKSLADEIEESHRFVDPPATTANHPATKIDHPAAALGAQLGKRMLARGAGELIGHE
jgi:hydroxymethylbilane synthase